MVKFNDLLESAKQEVDALEKRESNLQRNIKSLEGREAFLNGDIQKLEARQAELIKTAKDSTDKHLQDRQLATKELDDIKKSKSQLIADHEALKSSFETEIEDVNKQLASLNEDVLNRRDELSELLKAKSQFSDEIEILRADILSARDELKTFDEKINQARQKADEQIASFAAEVVTAQKQLATVNKQVTDTTEELKTVQAKVVAAQNKLAVTDKQHRDFLEYEKRAKTALKTHEQSLIEKEQQLDVQIVTSRRRGILGNVE